MVSKKRTRKPAKTAKKVLRKRNLPLTKKKMEQVKGGSWFIGRGVKSSE